MDNQIANLLVDDNDLFENIPPNAITIFGMYLNYKIIGAKRGEMSKFIIGRCICDLLDGKVARKYNK